MSTKSKDEKMKDDITSIQSEIKYIPPNGKLFPRKSPEKPKHNNSKRDLNSIREKSKSLTLSIELSPILSEKLFVNKNKVKDGINASQDKSESINSKIELSSNIKKDSYIDQLYTPSLDRKLNYLLASTLIRDARYTRVQIPFKKDKRSLELYELYYNKWLQSFYYIFMFINLGLLLFEEPKYIDANIPTVVISIINLICLTYFFLRWFHHFHVSDKKLFLKKKTNIMTPIILLIMLSDMGVYTTLKILEFKYRIQFSRFLRPLLLLTYPENFKLRSALHNIWVTIIDISAVFALFVFMLIFFSIICYQFLKRLNIVLPDGTKYFNNFEESFYQLYVLVTTSNSPDIIIPAYENSASYIVLYILVTLICNWILMGIIVASVYNAYKTHLGKYVIKTVTAKKSKLLKAFDLLKNNDNQMHLSTFVEVMRYVEPTNSNDHNKLLFRLLDINKSNTLSSAQFSKLTEFIHLTFTEIPISRTYFKRYIPKCYWCYMSRVNQFFVKLIRHRMSRILFEVLIICNGVTIIVFDDTPYELITEWAFTIIFTIEVILQIFASGINIYVRNYWNIFDFVVISLALISLILQMIITYFTLNFSDKYLDFLLTMRVLRILKLVSIIREFRTIMNCIIMLIPSLSYYAAIQMAIYYIYTCIGMEIFSNLYNPPRNFIYESDTLNKTVDCGNKNLEGSDFLNMRYCIFNFNNAFNGFLLLLILTVNNNWDILVSGTSLIVGNAARYFYISIHIICVLVVMNIVLAFIIDAYLMEIESSKGKYEEFIEQRLRELNLSAAEELEKLGIKHFGTEKFDLSYKVLNQAFPKNADEESEQEPLVCFALAEGIPKSLDSLLQRMFHDDIEKAQQEYSRFNYTISVQPISFSYSFKSSKNSLIPKEKPLGDNSVNPTTDMSTKNNKNIEV